MPRGAVRRRAHSVQGAALDLRQLLERCLQRLAALVDRVAILLPLAEGRARGGLHAGELSLQLSRVGARGRELRAELSQLALEQRELLAGGRELALGVAVIGARGRELAARLREFLLQDLEIL